MTQSFDDNLYLIDLSYLNTPSEVVYDLSTILDTDLAKNQRVKNKNCFSYHIIYDMISSNEEMKKYGNLSGFEGSGNYHYCR